MALIGFNANDTQFMTYFRLIRENIPFGHPACFVHQLWSAEVMAAMAAMVTSEKILNEFAQLLPLLGVGGVFVKPYYTSRPNCVYECNTRAKPCAIRNSQIKYKTIMSSTLHLVQAENT